MAKAAILSYIKRKSPVHELTGTTKLIYFITWSVRPWSLMTQGYWWACY